MENFKIIVFIMAILISLMAVSDRIKIPHPVILMGAGLVIGFTPVLPDLALNPDVVFMLILPPLLYDAAARTSWHEFRTSIRPISALAITLVFFTTVAVAAAAYYLIPGFTWPLAFVLGAIVSLFFLLALTSLLFIVCLCLGRVVCWCFGPKWR